MVINYSLITLLAVTAFTDLHIHSHQHLQHLD